MFERTFARVEVSCDNNSNPSLIVESGSATIVLAYCDTFHNAFAMAEKLNEVLGPERKHEDASDA